MWVCTLVQTLSLIDIIVCFDPSQNGLNAGNHIVLNVRCSMLCSMRWCSINAMMFNRCDGMLWKLNRISGRSKSFDLNRHYEKKRGWISQVEWLIFSARIKMKVKVCAALYYVRLMLWYVHLCFFLQLLLLAPKMFHTQHKCSIDTKRNHTAALPEPADL